jgi:hypothetical protein
VGALALAGHRANAVGAVRVTLLPLDEGGAEPPGLTIELIRVAGFSLGFAPGGVAEPVSFRVPYTAVRGLVREGRVLYLAFDPAVVTPYNRFALAGFAEDPAESLARAFRARARARWASYLVPGPAGALAGMLVPEDLSAGVLGRASVGALVALVLFAVLRELWVWRTWGGPLSDRLRDRFEAELAARLALVPTLVVRPPSPLLALRLPAHRRALRAAQPLVPQARPAESVAPAPQPSERLAWPLALAVAAAAGLVGVMVFLQRYAGPQSPPPAVELLASGLGHAARSVRPDVHEVPDPERCTCARADSPLWKDGVPTLAMLTFHGDDEASAPLVPTIDRAERPQLDFDLAVVNDGARPLRDVRLTLSFARRSPAGRRVGAVDRGLFWGGLLPPGAAVKWRVSAPGSEMVVDASVTGTLAKARLDPAPADAFFRLLSSRFRAVRVHGALMLAYLRDPRADEAVRALGSQSAADEALLARIRRAAAPVIACDVGRDEGRVEACIFNGSSRAQRGLVLRDVVPSGTPAHGAPIEVAVPVHEGRRVTLAIPEGLGEEIAVGEPGAAD